MLLKLLLKIWPSLIPILSYMLWVIIVENIILKRLMRKKETIEGKLVGEGTTKKENVQKVSKFSLQNRYFIIVLYLSMILAIGTFISFAFSV